MKKKTFVVSIPMLPADDLKLLQYRYDDGTVSACTRFPGIALIEKHLTGKMPIRIITVRTDDDNENTGNCYAFFQEELRDLSKKTNAELNIDAEIIVPHNESGQKGKRLLKELFGCFEKEGYVYMDLTYGTKLTAIEMFAALHYAEIVEKCSIKSVVYGKYAFDGSDEGELYDVTMLYHTVRFLDTAAHMDRKCFEDLIRQMLEK